jgi:hypothetical protein
MSRRIWAAVSTCAVLAAFGSAALMPALVSAQRSSDREAYFGETHVHTSWSLDAFAIGNVLTNPGDAYKYFKGEPIKHPLGTTSRSIHRSIGGA